MGSDRAGSGSIKPEQHNHIAEKASVVEGGNGDLMEKGGSNGGSSGKRKVVKRVVRVVRKVVRRKVPKKDGEGGGLGNKEEGKIENVEKNENMEMYASVPDSEDIEKAGSSSSNVNRKYNILEGDSSGLIKLRTSLEKSAENEAAKGDLAIEEREKVRETMSSDEKDDNFEANMDVCESMVADKVNSSGIASKECEKPYHSDALLLNSENEDSRNSVVKSIRNENNGSVMDSNVDSEKPIPLQGEITEDQLGTSTPHVIVQLESESSNDKLEKKDAHSGNADIVLDQNKVAVVESDTVEGTEGVAGALEDDSDRLNHGLAWSGEMEALERKKRRKTEIFVGGLDKSVKEEDIRKVFKDVGEIAELRLKMNNKTGKNKGFAFVRYASAADAKKALDKYSRVKICGKECTVSPVEGNDTIFLGNINRSWKTEDVVQLLKEAAIDKIDKVTINSDPNNINRNRGFAFVEFETCKDAQTAFHKLQKKGSSGSYKHIKVEWAKPLIEPDEEEILKVKSVYAEYLPSLWGEEEVREYFKRFGEIENVTLAKSLPSSRRKDFAFVNYISREAALACVEAFTREQIENDGSKVKVKVALANPLPKGKQPKLISNATAKEPPKAKRKAVHSIIDQHEPRKKKEPAAEGITMERGSSTTQELVQLLRQQAVNRPAQPVLNTGSAGLDHPFPLLGSMRPFPTMADDPRSLNPRGFPPLPLGRSYPVRSPSLMSSGVSMTSSSFDHHQQGMNYAPETMFRNGNYSSRFQRPQAFYYGNSDIRRP